MCIRGGNSPFFIYNSIYNNMRIIERLLEIVAPDTCLVCNEKEGSLICDSCAIDAFPGLPSRCYSCRRLTKDFKVCTACRSRVRLSNVWVCTQYEGVAKKIIEKMKLNSSRSVCDIIAKQMKETLPHLPSEVIIVPLPTATSRRRQRGFDHSELIAKNLSYLSNNDYYKALSREGQARQTGSGRQMRKMQVKGAYLPIKDVNNMSILLVDDIVTTGATIEEAAKVLKAAGASRVYAVVFAQK